MHWCRASNSPVRIDQLSARHIFFPRFVAVLLEAPERVMGDADVEQAPRRVEVAIQASF
jgi:hypothetical protein